MTEHGPVYNVTSPALAKHRAKAREGLSAMSYEDRRAYGEAVEAAILAAQRRQLRTAGEPEHRPSCASRSWANAPGDLNQHIESAGLGVRANLTPRLSLQVEGVRRFTRHPTSAGGLGVSSENHYAGYFHVIARF